MATTSILSWNVAGIRACIKKGGLDFLLVEDHDIVCFQETKAEEHQVKLSDELKAKYPHRYWHATQGITQRKGLSGTSIWSKTEPTRIIEPMEIDVEGRTIALEFTEFIIVTVYTPNSQKLDSERFKFRTEEWDVKFREYINDLNKIKPVIICGDLNVAHKDIDIHNPDQNRNKSAGFLNAEKDNFDILLQDGYIDSFRKFCDSPSKYTYWDQRNKKLRENNKGWRIDYFLVYESLIDKIKDSKIRPEIYGSDHCPIEVLI